MIRLEHVRHAVGKTLLLNNVSLHVGKGEALCLCGPSGIGKTTLLEIAAGLLAPDSGRVRLDSTRVGCAFQDDALVPWLSALENLLLVLEEKGNEARRIARHWLGEFGLSADQRPPAMSGGMRRRLSLARAFAVRPRILLLDEPFAFLDDRWQETVSRLAEECRTSGGALLLVSHQERRLADVNCRVVRVDQRPIRLDFEEKTQAAMRKKRELKKASYAISPSM